MSTQFARLRTSLRAAGPSLRCSWAKRHTTARSDSRCSIHGAKRLGVEKSCSSARMLATLFKRPWPYETLLACNSCLLDVAVEISTLATLSKSTAERHTQSYTHTHSHRPVDFNHLTCSPSKLNMSENEFWTLAQFVWCWLRFSAPQ